jgi:ABC-type branched-subunit amino acid transport system substrate-binding protein
MAYDPAKSVETYRRLREWGAQFMHLTAGSMVLTNLDAITRDRMPMVYYGPVQPNSAAAKPAYTIGEFPAYTDEEAIMMDWVVKNWTGSKPPRVGFLHLETAMARAELPGQVPDYAKKIGVEYVGHEWVPYAVTDTSVELKRLADKGADWIFLSHVPAANSVALKDAIRLGLKDKVKFVVVHWGFNELLAEAAGDAADGVYGMVPAALPNEDLPGVKLARDTFNTYRPGDTFTSTYMQGFTLGRFMAEGLKTALQRVGYEKLTGEAINDALMGTKALDLGGVVPPVTINPDYAIVANSYRIGILEKGKFRIVEPNWMPSHDLNKGWIPPQ